MSHLHRVREEKGRRKLWSERGVVGLEYPALSPEARRGRRHRLMKLKLAGGR